VLTTVPVKIMRFVVMSHEMNIMVNFANFLLIKFSNTIMSHLLCKFLNFMLQTLPKVFVNFS
jgi:hypothetical protein